MDAKYNSHRVDVSSTPIWWTEHYVGVKLFKPILHPHHIGVHINTNTWELYKYWHGVKSTPIRFRAFLSN